ncbi:MAG: PilZ domain-containing protein [Sphingomicrobium sp.]
MKTFVARAERRPVNLRGYALGPNRDSDILVADLSYTGCQIRCDEALKAGEIVELRVVKRGAIDAEIRWAAKGLAGAKFLN